MVNSVNNENEDAYFDEDTTEPEPEPEPAKPWPNPLSCFASSIGDKLSPHSTGPGKYLHLDGASFPANMSPLYNWTLMLVVFGIMLIGPLVLMQIYKPG